MCMFAMLGMAGDAYAQNTAEWIGGKVLRLHYEVEPRTVGSDYSYTAEPFLYCGDDTLRFDAATWRGKRNIKKLVREMVLAKRPVEGLRFDTVGVNGKRVYDVELNVEDYPWLRGDVNLCMQRSVEGCCDVDMLADTCLLAVEFEPVLETPFVPEYKGVGGRLAEQYDILEEFKHYVAYDSTMVLRKIKGALYVHFPVNKTTLLRDFRNNAATLDQIVKVTKAIMADTTSNVRAISVIGLASVEGPRANNIRLGEGRTKALVEYVHKHAGVPYELFVEINGGEAWTELRDQINDSDSPYREDMLKVIDTEKDPDVRERKLRRLDGGKAYNYLRDNVLRDQRNSGYIRVWYDYVPDTVALAINEAAELLRAEKYDEAKALLEPYKTEPRAQNVYGVILWYKGDKDGAVECFRRGAANGDEGAKKNLEQLGK